MKKYQIDDVIIAQECQLFKGGCVHLVWIENIVYEMTLTGICQVFKERDTALHKIPLHFIKAYIHSTSLRDSDAAASDLCNKVQTSLRDSDAAASDLCNKVQTSDYYTCGNLTIQKKCVKGQHYCIIEQKRVILSDKQICRHLYENNLDVPGHFAAEYQRIETPTSFRQKLYQARNEADLIAIFEVYTDQIQRISTKNLNKLYVISNDYVNELIARNNIDLLRPIVVNDLFILTTSNFMELAAKNHSDAMFDLLDDYLETNSAKIFHYCIKYSNVELLSYLLNIIQYHSPSHMNDVLAIVSNSRIRELILRQLNLYKTEFPVADAEVRAILSGGLIN